MAVIQSRDFRMVYYFDKTLAICFIITCARMNITTMFYYNKENSKKQTKEKINLGYQHIGNSIEV